MYTGYTYKNNKLHDLHYNYFLVTQIIPTKKHIKVDLHQYMICVCLDGISNDTQGSTKAIILQDEPPFIMFIKLLSWIGMVCNTQRMYGCNYT